MKEKFNEEDLDRIIEMAWEDRTPFEAIKFQFDVSEKDVIKIMRKTLKLNSFHLNKNDLKEIDKIKRLNIINAVSGIKPGNLIGTISNNQQTNLAVFSSVIHLGSKMNIDDITY